MPIHTSRTRIYEPDAHLRQRARGPTQSAAAARAWSLPLPSPGSKHSATPPSAPRASSPRSPVGSGALRCRCTCRVDKHVSTSVGTMRSARLFPTPPPVLMHQDQATSQSSVRSSHPRRLSAFWLTSTCPPVPWPARPRCTAGPASCPRRALCILRTAR